LPYSSIAQALDGLPTRLPTRIRKQPVHMWIEEMSLHGANVWLWCKGGRSCAATLRSHLLDAGLDPFRDTFPPLMDDLRAQLDPELTLVVMEG
jgi:hypothetical protein